MAKPNGSYKSKLAEYLGQIGSPASRIVCKDKRNMGKILFDIYVWQEVEDYADKAVKAAWKRAQAEEVIPANEKLRALGQGDHAVRDVESSDFSLMVTMTKPRANFDLDVFIKELAKRYKLPVEDLTKLAEECKSEGKAALQKRIVEVKG